MTTWRLRLAASGLYGIAMVAALLYGGGGVFVGVAIIGGMATGLVYTLTRGEESPDSERAARRVARRQHRLN